jgi:predicted DCC family thiol-disulfide oxidoreductase YuxK
MDITVQDNANLQPGYSTLIYDDDCRFCVRSKERLQRLCSSSLSTSVRYIPYQSAEAENILGKEYQPGKPEVAYLIGIDGQVHKGLDAMLPLLARLPGGWLLRNFMAIPGCRQTASWLYRLLARYRYHLFGAMPKSKTGYK